MLVFPLLPATVANARELFDVVTGWFENMVAGDARVVLVVAAGPVRCGEDG
jgi:hypothetical protein